MAEITVKVGKELPLSLLSRTQSWRLKIIDTQSAAMTRFDDASVDVLECPVCHESSEEKGAVRGIPYRACSACSHLFSGRMPSEDFLADYYAQAESAQIDSYVNLVPVDVQNRQIEIASQKVEFVREILAQNEFGFVRDPKLWIDVGCGVGDLLVSARELGYKTLGIEADRVQSDVARGRGIQVLNQFLSANDKVPEEILGAEVMSLLNVVEHVADPQRFLESFCGSLKKGSALVIEVPRYPSLSAIFQLAGIHEIHRYINPPEHLNIFSDESMRILMRNLGFELAGIWRYGSDALEAFSSVGDCLGWTGGFNSEPIPDLVASLQDSVDRSNLSDNMIVVAKKS